MRLFSVFVLFACACSGGGTSLANGDGGTLADGAAPAVVGPGATGTTPAASGSPHTPATGCRAGFDACGDVCADTKTDNRHCGRCGNKCGYADGGTLVCEDGECVAATEASCTRLTCGGACVKTISIDNCGSCFNACGDRQVCFKDACVDGKGDGKTCGTGLVLPDDEHVEFRYPAGLIDSHTFRCGGTTPVPTRWFRWTSTKTGNVTVQVEAADTNTDTVVEVFTEPSCEQGSHLGCNDDDGAKKTSELGIEVITGKTYYIALGLATPTSTPIGIRMDD